MNKKQYIFLFLLVIFFYLVYLILQNAQKQYIIRQYKESQIVSIREISSTKKENNNIKAYKSTRAYRNKILKEQQWESMKWEKVIYLIYDEKYNIFSNSLWTENTSIDKTIKTQKKIISQMSPFEKWVYFILKQDIRDVQ